MRKVKVEDLVVNNTYYDIDSGLGSVELVYKGKDKINDDILFTPNGSHTRYSTNVDGYINFPSNEHPFFED